jgi:hypothetical protein
MTPWRQTEIAKCKQDNHSPEGCETYRMYWGDGTRVPNGTMAPQ